jgi:hypothetical protein
MDTASSMPTGSLDVTDLVGKANQQQQQSVSQVPTQPQQPKEDWWQRLLPTVGGIAVPLLGAALAPETGGLSLLASSALSGLGTGAGKALENVTSGQDPWKDVLPEAAGSAITSYGTGALLGGIGKLVGAGAQSAPVKQFASDKASQLLQNQGGGYLPKDTADYLTKTGHTDLEKFVNEVHPVVTGSKGALNIGVRDTLGKASDAGSTINLSSYDASKNVFGEGIENATSSAGIADGTDEFRNVGKIVRGELGRFVKPTQLAGTKANVDTFAPQDLANFNLNDALDFTRALDKKANVFLGKAYRNNPSVQQQGQALRNISSDIKDTLYGVGSQLGGQNIPDDIRASMLKAIEPLKEKYPAYYADKAAVIANPNSTIGDLRSAQYHEVKASQALQDKAAGNQFSKGSTAADIALPIVTSMQGGPAVGLATYGAVKGLESKPGNVLAGKFMQRIIQGGGQPGKIAGTLGRIGNLGALGGLGVLGGAGVSTLPNLIAQPAGGAANMQQQQGAGAGGQQEQAITRLFNTLIAQERAGGGLTPNSGALISALSSLAGPAQQTQMLGQLQQGLGQAYAGAGGAQGTLGGLLTQASGLIPGSAANLYGRQQQGVASLLQSLYGINPAVGAGLTPQFTQTPASANIASSVLGL